MFYATEQTLSGVDVLIINAGVPEISPLAGTSDETFDEMAAINARGTFNTLCEAAKSNDSDGRIGN